MAQVFFGSGPGVQTPDGCSVDLYRVLPYMGELEDIQPALQQHSEALELGCGTGRLCQRMLELGIQATGVDESAEMLAHLPPGVQGVRSSIEELSLGRTWPAVLLPSHLINHPEEGVRHAFIATARRHISDAGNFFVKRHNPAWLAAVQPGPIGQSHGVTYFAEQVARLGDCVTMTLRYEASSQVWTQSFSTTALSEVEVEDQLRRHGFKQFQWFGKDRLWVSATASDASRSSGAPTADHQARAGGTQYIFTSPGLASCRRRPLSSNVPLVFSLNVSPPIPRDSNEPSDDPPCGKLGPSLAS